MGIVVDINRSEVKFKDPLLLYDPMNVITNQILFDPHSFTIKFGISFDPDPTKGFGGAPPEAELWRIGLVQNVLFERLNFEYENKQIFKIEFEKPAPDFIPGSFSKPFYADPVLVPTRQNERPVSDIWLTSQGYGELLNPYDASGVAINNKPDALDMWDQPSGGTRLKLKDGSMISRIEKVVSFQTWLVAKTESKTEVLAHVPAFSLVFWFETTPAKTDKPKYSFDTPAFRYGVFGTNGIFGSKKIDRTRTGIGDSPTLKPALGNGGRNPVMFGQAAVERGNDFLDAYGLNG